MGVPNRVASSAASHPSTKRRPPRTDRHSSRATTPWPAWLTSRLVDRQEQRVPLLLFLRVQDPVAAQPLVHLGGGEDERVVRHVRHPLLTEEPLSVGNRGDV